MASKTFDTNIIIEGTNTANSHVTVGGASTDFVKGDGSLDSNTYVTGNLYTTNGTISGNRTVTLSSNELYFTGGRMGFGTTTVGTNAFNFYEARDLVASEESALVDITGVYNTGSTSAKDIYGINIDLSGNRANTNGYLINTATSFTGTGSTFGYSRYAISNQRFATIDDATFDGQLTFTGTPVTSNIGEHLLIRTTHSSATTTAYNHKYYNIYSDHVALGDWNTVSNALTSKFYGIYSRLEVFNSSDMTGYGLYIDNVTSNTSHFGLYQNQSGVYNYFAGNVGIGTETPAQALDVNGNIAATSFITDSGTSSQFVKGDGSLDSNTYLTNITGETLSDLSDVPAEPTAGSANYFLQYADTGDTFSWVDVSTLGGGTIGGSITDNQIAVGATTADDIEGNAAFTYDATTDLVTLGDNTGSTEIRLSKSDAGTSTISFYNAGAANSSITHTNLEGLIYDSSIHQFYYNTFPRFRINSTGILSEDNAGGYLRYNGSSLTSPYIHRANDTNSGMGGDGIDGVSIISNSKVGLVSTNTTSATNIELFGSGGSVGALTAGEGVLRFNNVTTVPTGSATGGGLVFVNSDALYFKDSTALASQQVLTDTTTLADLSDIPAYPTGTTDVYVLRFVDLTNTFSWVDIDTIGGTGTVTSVAISGTDGIEVVSGSPITTSGTITLGFEIDNIGTSLTSGLVSTDELVISDAGVTKKMDVSVLETYMQSNLTFGTMTDWTLQADTGSSNIMVDGDTVDIGGGTGITTTIGTISTSTQVTVDLTQQFEKSLYIESPGSSEDITIGFFNYDITVEELASVANGLGPSVTWNIKHASARNAAGTTVSTSNVVTTSLTGQNQTTGFNDNTIPADSWVWLETSATAGGVGWLSVTMIYTID